MKQPKPYLITYSFDNGCGIGINTTIKMAKHSFDACMMAGIDFSEKKRQAINELSDPKIISVKRLTRKELNEYKQKIYEEQNKRSTARELGVFLQNPLQRL